MHEVYANPPPLHLYLVYPLPEGQPYEPPHCTHLVYPLPEGQPYEPPEEFVAELPLRRIRRELRHPGPSTGEEAGARIGAEIM